MLEMRQVSKVYGDGLALVHALREVDLQVAAGELVAIMGPSGSGKSSLLTIAGTLEDATSGEVVVAGRALQGMGRKEKAALRRRSIGFVFQDFNLLAARALDELGLTERASHYPDDLSGGERQRVAIARAIVGERRLLLADEPTGALDSVNSESVMRLLRDITRRGAAAVVVTHEAQLAAWADRVVFLRDGSLVDQTGTPAGPESLLATGPQPTS